MKKVLSLNLNDEKMDNTGNELISAVLWPLTILLSWVASIDRSTITFTLGTIVSVLAVAHYVIQIHKNLKKNKNENQQ